MRNENPLESQVCTSNDPFTFQAWLGHTTYNYKIQGELAANTPAIPRKNQNFCSI